MLNVKKQDKEADELTGVWSLDPGGGGGGDGDAGTLQGESHGLVPPGHRLRSYPSPPARGVLIRSGGPQPPPPPSAVDHRP